MIVKHIKHNIFKGTLSAAILFFAAALAGAQTPAPPQKQQIVIAGATIHTGKGNVIENGTIAFNNGKIVYVGNSDGYRPDPSKETVISAPGKHVYPGFIAPYSILGLVEIEAVRASRDYSETGIFNPHVRSIIAYNAESRITPTVRSNGVLMAQISPRGGVIPGTSSIVQLDAWNWEDAVYAENDGVHLNWPAMYRKTGWWAEPGNTEKEKEYENRLKEIMKFFEEARAYSETAHPEKNLKLEAMRGVFSGKRALYINADDVKEITEAVNFATAMKIPRMVIVGGRDSWMVAPLLKEKNIPVILSRVHELPDKKDDDVDQPYKLPYILQKEGVLFCLNYSGDMEAMGLRNLPFTAGTAAAYGLTKEEALSSITLNTAKILGIDKTTGSLETGKDATLFISSGDALDMRTNMVEQAFIIGRSIDLNNHQKELYLKYHGKYKK